MYVPPAARTKYQRLRGSNDRDLLLFHGSGDLKFKIKVPAGLAPSEGEGRPVPGLSVCNAVSTLRDRPCVHASVSAFSLLVRTPVPLGQGPP